METPEQHSVDQAIRSLELQGDITKLLKQGHSVQTVLSLLKYRAELLLTLHSFASDLTNEVDEQALLLAIKYASEQIENDDRTSDLIIYNESELEPNVEKIILTLKNDDFNTTLLEDSTTFLARFIALHDKYHKTVPAKPLFDELMTQLMDMFNANGVWKHI